MSDVSAVRTLVGWIPAVCSALYFLVVLDASGSTGELVTSVWQQPNTSVAGRVLILGAVFLVATVVVRMVQDRLTEWLGRDLGHGAVANWLRARNTRRRDSLNARLDAFMIDASYSRSKSPRREQLLMRTIRQLEHYPSSGTARTTTLGNVQAAEVTRIADVYGLDLHVVWPRIVPLLGGSVRAAVTGAHRRLEFMVAVTAATAFTAALVIPSFSVLPFDVASLAVVVLLVVSRLAYTGAVAASAEFGEARRVAVDLHRFDLLEAMHLPLPADASEERGVFRRLSAFLARGLATDVNYVHTVQARQVRDEVHEAVHTALTPPDPVNFRGVISATLRSGDERTDLLVRDDAARAWRVPVGIPMLLVATIATGEDAVPATGRAHSSATLPLEVRGGRTAKIVELDLDIDGPFLEIENPDTRLMCPVEGATVRYETTLAVPRAGHHDLRISVYSSNRLIQVLVFELVAEDEH